MRRPRWLLLLARVSLVGLLLVSVVTLRTMATGAEKQQYCAVVTSAADAAIFNAQIVAIGYVTSFFDACAPPLHYEERPFLTHLAAEGGIAALWLAYGEDPWEDMPAVRANLAALGFARLIHQQFGNARYLALFARRDASLGAAIPPATDFDPAAGWHRPSVGATRGVASGATELTLMADGNAIPRASLLTTGRGGGLYALDVGFRTQLTSGRALASLTCLDGAGETLALASSESPIPAEPATLRVGAWCPNGTQHLRLDLDNRGTGTVAFQNVRLSFLPAAP